MMNCRKKFAGSFRNRRSSASCKSCWFAGFASMASSANSARFRPCTAPFGLPAGFPDFPGWKRHGLSGFTTATCPPGGGAEGPPLGGSDGWFRRVGSDFWFVESISEPRCTENVLSRTNLVHRNRYLDVVNDLRRCRGWRDACASRRRDSYGGGEAVTGRAERLTGRRPAAGRTGWCRLGHRARSGGCPCRADARPDRSAVRPGAGSSRCLSPDDGRPDDPGLWPVSAGRPAAGVRCEARAAARRAGRPVGPCGARPRRAGGPAVRAEPLGAAGRRRPCEHWREAPVPTVALRPSGRPSDGPSRASGPARRPA